MDGPYKPLKHSVGYIHLLYMYSIRRIDLPCEMTMSDHGALHTCHGQVTRQVFRKLQNVSSYGLRINTDKTVTMVLNTENTDETIVNLRNSNLKNVNLFNYLGAFIAASQPETGESEINHRIQLPSVKFAEMSNLLQNFHVNLHTRVEFLNFFVRSRLTYASQNWSLTTNQFDRLDTTYRTLLRHIIRNGFRQVDRESNDFRLVISNAQLHSICGTRDVSTFIRTQQSNYASHVIRMSHERSLND